MNQILYDLFGLRSNDRRSAPCCKDSTGCNSISGRLEVLKVILYRRGSNIIKIIPFTKSYPILTAWSSAFFSICKKYLNSRVSKLPAPYAFVDISDNFYASGLLGHCRA